VKYDQLPQVDWVYRFEVEQAARKSKPLVAVRPQ
jgi:hypothetical protein